MWRSLEEKIPVEGENLRLARSLAEEYFRTHTGPECWEAARALYVSPHFQVQEAGVFLCGWLAPERPEALAFLRDTVSAHESWRVQEVLAMAFDACCRETGYEAALPVIRAWLADGRANVRRAVSEGLRVWTARPYFKEHPEEAVCLLAARRADESAYVRKSVGNALRDISKTYPALIRAELETWDTGSKAVMQVYRLASKKLEPR